MKEYVQHMVDGGHTAPDYEWHAAQTPIPGEEPEPDTGPDEGLASVLRWVGELWLEDSAGFEILMARMLFPAAAWKEMPVLMSREISRQGLHKAAKKLAADRPELDSILFPPRQWSRGQRERRQREAAEGVEA